MNPPMGNSGDDHHKMIVDNFRKRSFETLINTISLMLLRQQFSIGFNLFTQ
jgi:hypothetical protein